MHNQRRWFVDMFKIASKSMAAFLFALSVYSCTGDSTVDPVSDSDQLIPFKVGNQWTYADSVFTSSGLFVSSYTVTVTRRIDTLGGSWWQIMNAFNPSIASNIFSVNGDSIFSLQATESINGAVPIVSLEYVRPTNDDTVRYRALLDGDAVVTKVAANLKSPCSLSGGTFENCIVCTYDIFPEHYQEIVSPGTGMIALEIRADSIPRISPAWQRKIVLVDYRIQK